MVSWSEETDEFSSTVDTTQGYTPGLADRSTTFRPLVLWTKQIMWSNCFHSLCYSGLYPFAYMENVHKYVNITFRYIKILNIIPKMYHIIVDLWSYLPETRTFDFSTSIFVTKPTDVNHDKATKYNYSILLQTVCSSSKQWSFLGCEVKGNRVQFKLHSQFSHMLVGVKQSQLGPCKRRDKVVIIRQVSLYTHNKKG